MKRLIKKFDKEEDEAVLQQGPEVEERLKDEELLGEVEVRTEAEEREDLADLTERELAAMISEELNDNDEILSFIPGLKAGQDEKGNTLYSYAPKGQIAKKLEELDAETLIQLFERVMSESNRLNNERIMRQLEQVRRMQQMPKAPPKPPGILRVPSPPQRPSAPPAPPVPQSSPPRPPRR